MMQPYQRITTVLVRPIYARNAGMCSRAICNVGGGRLILIAPAFDPASNELREGAANGQRPLHDLTIYNSLEEFYSKEGEGVRIALTARDNRIRSPQPLDVKLESLLASENEQSSKSSDTAESRALFDPNQQIYLFFGPEDDGLSFDDMKLCHHLCSLPVEGDVKSLNLSHAVLLTLHIVAGFLKRIQKSDTPVTTPVAPKKAYYPEKTIDRWLEAMGFSLDKHRVNMALALHRMLLDHQPRASDLKMLETILEQNIRKLNDAKK